jgi:hypothetical protein
MEATVGVHCSELCLSLALLFMYQPSICTRRSAHVGHLTLVCSVRGLVVGCTARTTTNLLCSVGGLACHAILLFLIWFHGRIHGLREQYPRTEEWHRDLNRECGGHCRIPAPSPKSDHS